MGVVLLAYCVILPAIKLSAKLATVLIINMGCLGRNDYEAIVFIG